MILFKNIVTIQMEMDCSYFKNCCKDVRIMRQRKNNANLDKALKVSRKWVELLITLVFLLLM